MRPIEHLIFVFSQRFRRKCTTFAVACFFRQFNAISPLSCSIVQQQLELRTSKTYSKRQNLVHNKNIDVQNLENIGPLWCFPLGFFRHYATFFGFHQRVSPSDNLQHNGCQKIPKSPPFTIFGTVTL